MLSRRLVNNWLIKYIFTQTVISTYKSSKSKQRMKPPVEPNIEDCCNSGCDPCIFDIYQKQLKIYKKFLESGEAPGEEPGENAISQLEYTEFKLVESTEICDSHRVLLFKRVNKDDKKVHWKPGDHFLLKYTIGPVCTRAYTPLKQPDSNKDYDFSIIVKRYEAGLVSKYLSTLNKSDTTLWRGPYGQYEITANKFDRIFMVAQGVGITPFISIIESILENEDDFTKLFLFFCCESIEKTPLRENMIMYKHHWNFTYKIFLGQNSDPSKHKYQEPVVNHKLTIEEFSSFQPFSSKDQFNLCGTSKFMSEYNGLLKQHYKIANVVMF